MLINFLGNTDLEKGRPLFQDLFIHRVWLHTLISILLVPKVKFSNAIDIFLDKDAIADVKDNPQSSSLKSLLNQIWVLLKNARNAYFIHCVGEDAFMIEKMGFTLVI